MAQIIGRERRERLSQLTWCGGGCFDSRRRVNSTVGSQLMSIDKNDIPQEFYDLVDRFINLANDLEKEWPRSRVSATLMFAAARYNVFNWLNRDVDLEQNLGAAVAYYREQYGKMFQDNVEELTPVYAKPDIPGQDAT